MEGEARHISARNLEDCLWDVGRSAFYCFRSSERKTQGHGFERV